MPTEIPQWSFADWKLDALQKFRDEHVASVKYVKECLANGATNWTTEELTSLESAVAEADAELASR